MNLFSYRGFVTILNPLLFSPLQFTLGLSWKHANSRAVVTYSTLCLSLEIFGCAKLSYEIILHRSKVCVWHCHMHPDCNFKAAISILESHLICKLSILCWSKGLQFVDFWLKQDESKQGVGVMRVMTNWCIDYEKVLMIYNFEKYYKKKRIWYVTNWITLSFNCYPGIWCAPSSFCVYLSKPAQANQNKTNLSYN